MRVSCRSEVTAPHYFVHIPKTGGTTLISVLDRFFCADQICPWQLWAELPDDPDFAPYQLIRGHFGGGGLRSWLPAQTRHLTMLRDPESLVLSTYGHIRREPGTRFHQQARSLSFEDFLTGPQTGTVLTNRQTAFLSFDPEADPGSGLSLFAPRSAQRVTMALANPEMQLTETQRLERAAAMLESCVWFGMLERFEESMWLLSRYFSAPQVGALHRARDESREREALRGKAAGLRARMRELTGLDQALHASATAQFEARLAAAKRHIDIGTEPARPAPDLEPGQRLRYGFDAVLMGSGWHGRERKLPEGDYFRWTGPGPVSLLRLPCNAARLQSIRLRVVNGVSDEVIDAMTWLVNGVQVVPEDLQGSGPVREFIAVVPKRARMQGQLELEICLPYTRRLSEAIDDVDDNREVGVAIHWIELSAVDLQAGE